MLFYFTATGNSLYVAKRLDPRCISIAQAIHDDPQPYQDAQIDAIRADLNARRHFILPPDAQDEPERWMRPDMERTMFVIREDCIGCGICRKICPMDRFTIQAQKSQYDPKGCIACMACIHACPMNAIQLTIPEKNRNARYRNAHITLCELIEANDQHPYKKDMHDKEEKR